MVVLISVLMNFSFFLITYIIKLPLWLDTTGTIYASIILGFPVGFIVAIINNVTQALFFYGVDSLTFYLVSAITAFVSGSIMTKYKNRPKSRWFLLTVTLLVVSVTLAVVITFIANKGLPSDYWGQRLYFFLQQRNINKFWATVIAVSMIKILDIIVSVILVYFVYRFTPEVIREDKAAVV